MELEAVGLARVQFAVTAMYHFLFVPLTLGLSFLMAIMETVYVMTNRPIWRDMTKFWGKLFGINFAMGVATGITMEFQFGTNWSYYSHYVGDIFGTPLAIEGMMAFFLESTFVGLFFFGWDRLSKRGHLVVTWLVALGSNLSALWILIANGFMQHPVGSEFNFETMRMEMTDLAAVIFNPIAQAKFVHTVSAGYTVGAVFVVGISSLYLLRRRHVEFARRSFTVGAAFGLAAICATLLLGDESGYITTEHQKMKLAAMEADWETAPAPAPWTLFGIPDRAAETTHYRIEIPWVGGLIATRSLDTVIPGIHDLVERNRDRIREGLVAYEALQTLREDPDNAEAREILAANDKVLGYALLLKRYTDDPTTATPEMIDKAALDTVPDVFTLFFSFRIMVFIGGLLLLYFVIAFYLSATEKMEQARWFLRVAPFAIPLPYLAAEFGWVVAEHGRQPWTIEGVLPTFLSASSVGVGTVAASLTGFVLFYSALLVVDVALMVRYVRMGPPRALGYVADPGSPRQETA